MPELTAAELKALKSKSTLIPQGDISPEEIKKLKMGDGYKQSEDPSILEGWRGKFRKWGAPLVRSGLVNGGRAVGLATGIELGPGALGTSVIGGMAGDQAYQGLQKMAPDLYGENTNGVVDSVKESANNAALEMIGNELFGKISKFAGDHKPGMDNVPGSMAWKLKKMRQNHTPAQLEALANAPKDLNMSTGQVTGSKSLQQVEDLLGSSTKKHNIVEPAKKVIREEIDNIGQGVARRPSYNLNEPYTVRGTNAEKLAKGLEKGYTEGVDKLYDNFRTKELNVNPKMVDHMIIESPGQPSGVLDASGNPVPTQPTRTLKAVKGPIYMDNTQQAAQAMLTKIDETLSDPSLVGLDEVVTKLQKMRNAVDGFTNLPKTITGSPVQPWEIAKDTRGTLHEMIDGIQSDSTKKKLSATFNTLSSALEKDYQSSVAKWPKSAQESLDKAASLAAQKATKYEPAFAKEIVDKYKDPDMIMKKLFDSALQDPEHAAHYVNTVGDKRELGAEYVTRGFRAAERPDGSFDGAALKNFLLSTRDVAKVPLTAPQRASLDYLSTVIQHTGMAESSPGKYSLAFRGATAIIGVGGGAASLIMGDDLPGNSKYAAATLFAIPLAGEFTKKILLNPTNARKLALLAKLPPTSQKATLLSKSLLLTLKAAGAKIQYADQIKDPAEDESMNPE